LVYTNLALQHYAVFQKNTVSNSITSLVIRVSDNLERTKLLCFVFCKCQELTGLHFHLEKLINIVKSYSKTCLFEKGLRNITGISVGVL